MARKSRPSKNIEALAEDLNRLLDGFLKQLDSDDVRSNVKALVPAFHKLRDLGSSLSAGEAGDAAMERIITYLRKYPFTVIDGDELMVVSGIGEWARRVRQLRVEQGWWISSGVTFREMAEDDPELSLKSDLVDVSDIRTDQYILLRAEPDADTAARWQTINGIRRSKGSVKDKILAYLRSSVGVAVSGEDLRYLAKNKTEWARRSRELRTQDGWPVATRMSGREDLPVGVYVLEEDKQAEAHDRNIGDDVRVAVLTRDEFKCTDCGWDRERLQHGDPRKFLELHHQTFHVAGGANSAANLITLCNVCHDKLHREHARLARAD